MFLVCCQVSTLCPFPKTVNRIGGSRSPRVDPAQAGTDREAIRLALEAQNIEARPAWKPMHLQPLFADAESVGSAVSEYVFASGLCLPTGSSMSDAQFDRVLDVLATAIATT